MFICCFDKNFLALLSCLPPESGIFMENVHALQLHVSSPQTFMTQIMHEILYILLSLEMWGGGVGPWGLPCTCEKERGAHPKILFGCGYDLIFFFTLSGTRLF